MSAAVLTATLLLTGVPAEKAPMPTLTASKTHEVMTGAKAPYRGKYWRKQQREYTLCVLKRESNNNWHSTARAAGYFGAFQFSKPLTDGATYMMTKELRVMYGDRMGRDIAAKLRATEMHKWLPFFQHMAFATVLNWESNGSGAAHWAGGRWRCAL
jgi:hypothetical protein